MNLVETPAVFDFDIVERFPEEICRNVFSNLTCNELLSASLVSKDWYSLIGRAPECMKKLTLVIGNLDRTTKLWPSNELNERLAISTRKYENIKLHNLEYDLDWDHTITSGVKDILEIRGRKWKKVELSFMTFETASDIFGVFSYIDQTVVKMKMSYVGIRGGYEIESCGLMFPKLKVLIVSGKNSPAHLDNFVNCTTLKDLAVGSYEDDDAVSLKVRDTLKRNKGLKELSISTSKEVFDNDISEGVQCKLTSLEIRCYELDANQKKNLQKFLRKQLASLKRLKFGSWVGVEATKMIFHMPNLILLKLDCFDCTEEDVDLMTIEFRSNSTITDLHLTGAKKVETLQAFFPVMTNVKHLKVSTVTEETLDLIATNFPNLESLLANSFEVTDVSEKDVLKNLKKLDFTYHKVGTEEPACHFARLVDNVIIEDYKNNFQSMTHSQEGRSRLLLLINEFKNQPDKLTALEATIGRREIIGFRAFLMDHQMHACDVD